MTAAAKVKKPQTPRESGFSMPAEWERHEAIWLSWPHDTESFPNLKQVEKTYVEIISAIHESEEVRLLVVDSEMERRVRALLTEAKIDLSRIKIFTADYADVWIRDYGPTFVLNRKEKQKAMVHWKFNAWGGKYDALLKDTRVPEVIEKHFPHPRIIPGIVMEGGSFDVNGEGTLLTTEQCLLNKNRNPSLKKNEIEKILIDYLSLKKIIWLKEGVAGDDTDGHVDDIARFVSKDTVVCAVESDERDGNYHALRENHELLKGSTDQNGKKLKVIPLPMPGVVSLGSRRLPASYTNFYIGNTVVLAPIFGQADDEKALEILRGCFPKRKVVGIRCNDMVAGFGAIHCGSQQEPAL